MKIGPHDAKNSANAVGERRSPSPAAGARGAEPSARLALSPALGSIGMDPAGEVFDAAKVQRISEAIRRGEYIIDAEAIAERLLINARELLGNGPGGPAAPGRA